MITSRDHPGAIIEADQEEVKTCCFPYDPPNKDLEQTHSKQDKEQKKRTNKSNTRKRDPLSLLNWSKILQKEGFTARNAKNKNLAKKIPLINSGLHLEGWISYPITERSRCMIIQ